MMIKRFILFLLLSTFACQFAVSQQKGNFDVNIEFAEALRRVSCFVPLDYDENTQYRLIVGLHGAGDRSDNYRNALINSFKWQNIEPQTIFIFPDGGDDPSRDFFSPEGDELFIFEAIDFIKDNYNIDTNSIVLQGFSLGGRSALRMGLNYPEYFKGLILNTPAVQGISELYDDEIYDFANSSKIPMVIIWGKADNAYHIICDTLYRKIIMNNGVAMGAGIDGLGHSVTLSHQMTEFLHNPYSPTNKIQIIEVQSDKFVCQSTSDAYAIFRNISADVIEKIEFSATVQDESQNIIYQDNYVWNDGQIKPFEVGVISINGLNIAENEENTLIIKVITANDSALNSNHHTIREKDIHHFSSGFALPYSVDFNDEHYINYWELVPSGSNFTFMPVEAFEPGNIGIFMFNHMFYFNNFGYAESMVTPVIDLTAALEPTIYFDMAFTYHTWGPPYFEQSFSTSDTLEIVISTDCGISYETIYKKSGNELRTTNIINNPLSIEQGIFEPNDDNKKKIEIDLTDYNYAENARFMIKYISGSGGCFFIDNFEIKEKDNTGISDKFANSINIYPNPAYNTLNIASDNIIDEFTVFDVNGNKIISKANNYAGATSIDVSGLPNGVYILELRKGNDYSVSRFVVAR